MNLSLSKKKVIIIIIIIIIIKIIIKKNNNNDNDNDNNNDNDNDDDDNDNDKTILTSTVSFVGSSSDGGTVVLRTWLAFSFSFLVHVKSSVAIYARVGGVVAVSSRGTVHYNKRIFERNDKHLVY